MSNVYDVLGEVCLTISVTSVKNLLAKNSNNTKKISHQQIICG